VTGDTAPVRITILSIEPVHEGRVRCYADVRLAPSPARPPPWRASRPTAETPSVFHVEKSEIAAELRRRARVDKHLGALLGELMAEALGYDGKFFRRIFRR
jgi:hypothetical protein